MNKTDTGLQYRIRQYHDYNPECDRIIIENRIIIVRHNQAYYPEKDRIIISRQNKCLVLLECSHAERPLI